MRFHACHGCLDWEKSREQEFEVDFSARYPLSKAAESDDLAQTLDYSAVYRIVEEQMRMPSSLLEHLAGRIARTIAQSFPGLEEFTVSLSKLNPPVGGPCESARVVFSYPEDL